MSLPELLKVTDTTKGLHPDSHPLQGHLWADGRNVLFDLNGVRKMEGWSAPLTPIGSTPVRGIGQLLANLQELFWGDQTNIYRWNTTAVASVGSGFTGNVNETITTPASTWSFLEWGSWMLASNGQDVIQVYKGTSFAALGGTPPTTTEILLKLGAYVLAFNTDDSDTTFEWCDEDDVESWVPGTGSTAGNLLIRDFDSAIVAAISIGDRIAVYGKDRMAIVTFIGTPFIFGYKIRLSGIGAVSKKSVVEVKGLNYGFSTKGFFVTDGSTYTYIDDGDIRDFVQDDINWSQASKINAHHDAKHTQIVWYYPTASSSEPDRGVTYNYKTKKWSILDHGRTASAERKIFQYPIVATEDGDIYFTNFGVDADGTAMTAYIESFPIPMYGREGNSLEDFIKYIDELKLAMKVFTGIQLKVRVGVQDRLDDPVIFLDDLIVEDPSAPLYPMVSTRWLTIRVESSAIGDNWSLQGLTVNGKKIGGPS